MDICTNPDILKVIYFFLIILDIVKIIIPIALIVLGLIDFSKAVISNDESAQKKKANLFFKRLFYAILVFITPWFVELLMTTLGDLMNEEINFTDCITNTKNISYYEELKDEKEKQEKEKKKKELEEKRLNEQEDNILKNNKKNNNSTEGTYIGQKYNLSDSQLKGIAMLCQREQGTAIGAAAEASLMANRFELFGASYGKGGDGLYNYVQNSKWWASPYSNMYGTPNKDVLTAVHEVLIQGKRTLSPYVDEHDCIDCGSYGFDVIKIVTDNNIITSHSELLNRNNYKKDETVIYNRYGSVYTFYTFPTETSDPFGYTETAKNKYNSLLK